MGNLILVVVVVAVLALIRKSRPADNKKGISLSSQQRLEHEPGRINVATYNIQTGKSLAGKRNLLASAQVISNAHLVGIQEVYAPGFDGLFSPGQTERLAQNGKFGWLFCATRRRWLREHRGNAILSKLRCSEWRIEMLPDTSGKSFRNMTIAKIHWKDEYFYFINTHLHTRDGREEQLAIVLQEFAKYPRAILLGDFNSRLSTEALANALKNIEITDAVSEAGLDLNNPERIDWILTKGFKVEAGEMQEKGVSDHPYYQVSLSYL